MASWYHLIYQDWNQTITRQAAVLGPLLEQHSGKALPTVLDCACGIGTQALGLAQRGYHVVGSDLSPAAIHRARHEAAQRNLPVPFHVADMRNLSFPASGFDAVLAADNALPHLLSTADLESALHAIAAKLHPGGILLATVRDYDRLLGERPTVQPPAFFTDPDGQRFVHQVWHWGGDGYTMHLYLTQTDPGRPSAWTVRHVQTRTWALRRSTLERALTNTGFHSIEWLEPAQSNFYQPVVLARR